MHLAGLERHSCTLPPTHGSIYLWMKIYSTLFLYNIAPCLKNLKKKKRNSREKTQSSQRHQPLQTGFTLPEAKNKCSNCKSSCSHEDYDLIMLGEGGGESARVCVHVGSSIFNGHAQNPPHVQFWLPLCTGAEESIARCMPPQARL